MAKCQLCKIIDEMDCLREEQAAATESDSESHVSAMEPRRISSVSKSPPPVKSSAKSKGKKKSGKSGGGLGALGGLGNLGNLGGLLGGLEKSLIVAEGFETEQVETEQVDTEQVDTEQVETEESTE